jgi:hypothetical protein
MSNRENAEEIIMGPHPLTVITKEKDVVMQEEIEEVIEVIPQGSKRWFNKFPLDILDNYVCIYHDKRGKRTSLSGVKTYYDNDAYPGFIKFVSEELKKWYQNHQDVKEVDETSLKGKLLRDIRSTDVIHEAGNAFKSRLVFEKDYKEKLKGTVSIAMDRALDKYQQSH